MALQKDIEFDNGINIVDGYINVTKVTIAYFDNDGYAEIFLSIFNNITSKTEGRPEILTISHICKGSDFDTYFSESVMALVGNTPITQAEEWLVTTPAYSGAIQV